MNTQQCKELIKKDLQETAAHINDFLNEDEDKELVDIETELNRIMRYLENAKTRLKGCEDY